MSPENGPLRPRPAAGREPPSSARRRRREAASVRRLRAGMGAGSSDPLSQQQQQQPCTPFLPQDDRVAVNTGVMLTSRPPNHTTSPPKHNKARCQRCCCTMSRPRTTAVPLHRRAVPPTTPTTPRQTKNPSRVISALSLLVLFIQSTPTVIAVKKNIYTRNAKCKEETAFYQIQHSSA